MSESFGKDPLEVAPVNSGDSAKFELSRLSPNYLAHLAEQYQQDRLVVIPQLLEYEQSAALLDATSDTDIRRVEAGDPNITWGEQNFEENHPAHQFFEQPAVTELVAALTRQPEYVYLLSWASIYSKGEFINSHRDASGSLHLLVCLKATASPENGGMLVIKDRAVFLNQGDGIAFEASQIDHRTTPLVATASEPDPTRTVLVGRYYL